MEIRKLSGCQWLLATVAMVGMSFPSALSAQSQSGGGTPTEQEGIEQAAPKPHVVPDPLQDRQRGVPGPQYGLGQCVPGHGCLLSGTTPCTIAVSVSSQFGSVTAGQVARARVFVNGLLTHPGDACCLNMSPNANGRPQTASMTFVARNVPPGNRVVRVQFSTSGGTGYADFRSLEVGVYRP